MPLKNILLILFILLISNYVVAGNNDKIKSSVKHLAGKITSTAGEEIPGVKITIIETNKTFFADLDGNFKLQVQSDKPYLISIESFGYATLQVKSTDLNLFSDLSLKEL